MRSVGSKTLRAILVAALLHTSVDAWLSTSRYPQCGLQPRRYSSKSLIERSVASTLSSDEANAPFISETNAPHKKSFAETPSNPVSTSLGNPTLYDILGALPNATRAELKQKYVALAKMTHPDAQRMAPSNGTDVSAPPPQYEFSEIARAYKLLSDPKARRRYDRSIQAELLTEQIASAVQNHPITELTIKAIGTIAIPLFRTMHKVATPSTADHTTTTSVVDEGSPAEPSAATPFERPQDRVPRTKNVAALERQAEQEYQELLQVRQQLQLMMLQRLRVALHTPQSGLTSHDAWMLLESFRQAAPDDDLEDESGKSAASVGRGSNSGAGISWVERLNFLRSSVEAEIEALQNTEMAYMQQQEVRSQAQQVHQTAMQDLASIRKSLIDAEKEESNARRVLEQAMEETRRQRNHYERISGQLFAAEHAVALASNELERLQNAILKQSESVRHSLIRKERAVGNDSSSSNGPNAPTPKGTSAWEDKPDPPMSPQVYSFPSRRPRTMVAKSAFAPQLLHSSESSMLGPWPKQPFTLSQREHEAMLDSSRVDLYSERTDTFLNEDYSDHSAKPMNASLDGLTIDASATDHEKVSFDLVQLQQQEEDMRKAADALETRVSELFEQIKQLRQ